MPVEQLDMFASLASAASGRDAIGTALFVGGPWDGRLEPIFDDGRDIRRVLNVPGVGPSLDQLPPDWLKPDMVLLPVVDYRLEVFHTPQKDFHFWRAPSLTPNDLMARLMVAYHQQSVEKD
jgi:hypothetical protein